MIHCYKTLIAVLIAWPLSAGASNACTDIDESKLLAGMYNDSYFPRNLVNRTKNILLELCNQIEKEQPQTIEAVYLLTHKATIKINDLQDDFLLQNSEIETGARESIGESFELILDSTEFDYDIEKALAPREW